MVMQKICFLVMACVTSGQLMSMEEALAGLGKQFSVQKIIITSIEDFKALSQNVYRIDDLNKIEVQPGVLRAMVCDHVSQGYQHYWIRSGAELSDTSNYFEEMHRWEPNVYQYATFSILQAYKKSQAALYSGQRRITSIEDFKALSQTVRTIEDLHNVVVEPSVLVEYICNQDVNFSIVENDKSNYFNTMQYQYPAAYKRVTWMLLQDCRQPQTTKFSSKKVSSKL